jgi:hypothetical protein
MNIKIVENRDFTQLCNMRSLLLILSCIGLFMLSSCSSEYSERLNRARELKQKLSEAIKEQERVGVSFNDEIVAILEEIDFHAKVSGNEELFIRELNK